MSIRIYVSKSQLKKFKINAENCDLYTRLQLSGHAFESSEERATEIMKELDLYGVFYTVKRGALMRAEGK